MIYDGHAYCFHDLRGDGGFSDLEQFLRYLQMGIGSHFQMAWRLKDRAKARNNDLVDLTHGWNLAALKDSTFHPARFGRFEWTVEGDIFAKQYFPPSL